MKFTDRIDAGRKLADRLARHRGEEVTVLGLPRGGVVVAAEVARVLGAPLEVLISRKLGAPQQPELGIGAIAEDGEGGALFVEPSTVALLGITREEIAEIARREAEEVRRRVAAFRAGRPLGGLKDRVAILIDDGVATGGTARAAIRALRALGPKTIVFAAPVAAASTAATLRSEVDELVCLEEPEDLFAVGAWYEDFRQVTDGEVIALLEAAAQTAANRSFPRREVMVDVGAIALEGALSSPPGARGIVAFAHGSGSSRRSPRNRFVADRLESAGLGTLLFDLLTAEEERIDERSGELRFDVDLLARRLIGATDWLRRQPEAENLPIGYFGSSTGAAAALIAAAARPQSVGAVVSRGGRPDLALDRLVEVRAPTLLIVGGADREVFSLNRDALRRLRAEAELRIVPGATHLFSEPGALEEVARLAAEWFVAHFGSLHAIAPP